MTTIVMQSNASGTGSITFSAPNTNTNQVLTIPDTTGNLVTTGTTGQVFQGDITVPSLNGGQLAGMRNRIINGEMYIDQRNGGNAVTPAASGYINDRWALNFTQISKLTVRVINGRDTSLGNYEAGGAPVGFSSSTKITVASAYTVLSTDNFTCEQVIEGANLPDIDWGQSSAKTLTASFWVKSSITGTFGFSSAISGPSGIYSYPTSFSIPTANTWTYITIPIAGLTAAAPYYNNLQGVYFRFCLAAGSTKLGGTDKTWTNAGNYLGTAGVNSLVSTLGATFYITGCQLEVGSVATPFEHRHYSTELALCQRYYEALDITNAVAHPGAGSGSVFVSIPFKVPKRATPTLTFGALASIGIYGANGSLNPTAISNDNTTTLCAGVRLDNASIGASTAQRVLSGGNVVFASAEF